MSWQAQETDPSFAQKVQFVMLSFLKISFEDPLIIFHHFSELGIILSHNESSIPNVVWKDKK